ncbi:MAG: tetratricopeptide repeat protein [Phycisphaerae bacterium]|nr:tetratricopeptide repeat protein [Phycisphaerae bacterium]
MIRLPPFRHDPHGEWRDGDDLAEQARRHFELGRFADAEAALRQALEQNPERPDWHFNLGHVLEQIDRNSEARAAYLRCHQLDPNSPEPLLAAARTLALDGLNNEAVKLIDQAISLDRHNDAAHAQKVAVLGNCDRVDEARDAFYVAQEFVEAPAFTMLSMAQLLEDADELQRASWCYREALRHRPEMLEVRTMYARCLTRQGDHTKALQNYMQVLREDPGDVDALIGCARLLKHLGREADAQEKLRRVVEIEPANVAAHYELGALAMRAARYERAAVEFELVLKLEPDRNAVRIDLAEAQYRRGRPDECRETLRHFMGDGLPEAPETKERSTSEASEAMRAHVTLLARAGALLSGTGLWAESAQVLHEAVRRMPAEAALWRALARARFEASDEDGGRIASRQTLELDPHCLSSHHNMALCALRSGRLDEATEWVNRGLKVKRDDEGLRRIRSRIWMARLRRVLRLSRS